MNLDLSKFKKISSSKKSTMLRHPNGHKIEIAHGGLTDKLKSELDKLPIHKADGGKIQRYSGESGDPADSDVKSVDDSSDSQSQPQAPVTINIGQPQGAPTPPPQAMQAPEPQQQPQAEPPPSTRDEAPQQAQAPVNNDAAVDKEVNDAANNYGDQAPAMPVQQAPQAPPMPPVKQELTRESQAWMNDLMNGHIQPKTYQDLFNEKSTIGKIGTMFGLLIGGAGSGLAHQPNALLGMMDKEISNDLEAQKQSKANAQNFLRINQEMGMNAAKISQMQKEGALTNAQAQLLTTDKGIKDLALSQNQMLISSYHSLVEDTNKMPEGPQKEQAKAVLGMVYNKIGEKINNINDAAAGSAAFLNSLSPSKGNSSEQDFQNRSRNLKLMGPQGETMSKDMESKHFPGLKGQSSVPLDSAAREGLNSGISFDQKIHRFMDWTKNHSGDLSPSDRNTGEAMAAELQGAYRQASRGGVYKEGEQNFISKLIDSTPTKFFNEIRVMPQLEAIAKENQYHVDQFAKSQGFEGYGSPTAKSQGSPQQSSGGIKEGTKTTSKSGKPVVWKNGQWNYIK